MEISRIVFVDDRNDLFDAMKGKTDQLKGTISQAIEKSNLNMNVSESAEIEMFYQEQKGGKWIPHAFLKGKNKEQDWVSNDAEGLQHYIDEARNNAILFFCDYAMDSAKKGLQEIIYNYIISRKNIIFVCYSGISPVEADIWLNNIVKQKHACHLIDTVLLISYEYNELLASIKETIIDEWE